MCTVILFYRLFDDYPLVIASNRDESYARSSAPPELLARDPVILGGRDLEGGGTWMGVNQQGLWVGIANRLSPVPNDPRRRSRGRLCLDLLGKTSCEDAVSLLNPIPAGIYNPFHLLIADKENGTFASYEERCETVPLKAGIHIMTNHGLDADHDRRRKRILNAHQDLLGMKSLPNLDKLAAALSDHGKNGSDSVCIHKETGGTRSSTILFLHEQTRRSKYYFAEGSPCRTVFRDYSALFRQPA